MAKSKSNESAAQDPSEHLINAIQQVDLKTLSYKQLRRLYATVMQTVDNVSEELTVRSEEDSAGDTVRVPVPAPAK